MKGHTNGITSITFSKDGDYFASGSSDCQLFVWKCNFNKGERHVINYEKVIPVDVTLKLQDTTFKPYETMDDIESNEMVN